MPQTKKLPAGFDPKKPNRRLGHVVPKFALGLVGEGFIAVDSVKGSAIGRIVYLGVDVTSADILKKAKAIHRFGISEREVTARLDHFLSLLEGFRIGQLVRCSPGEPVRLEIVPELSAYSKPLPLP